jgi:myo-inositol-1(or 4)-monophosphatase
MLHHDLTTPFPDAGWLSEEHIDDLDRLDRERVWIVDPIDGTREYLQGIPEFAISIGLSIGGVAVLGVVHNPATAEMHAGTATESLVPTGEGKGTGEPYDVLVGRGEAGWDEVPPLPGKARVVGMGSVAYRLARIAAGKGDTVVTNYGRAEWDVAAGIALCHAAGLVATDVLGEPIRFNKPDPDIRGLLVARQPLHAEIRTYFDSIMRRR